jgi:hypothetical protein
VQPALRLGAHVARRGGGVNPFVQVNNLNRFSSPARLVQHGPRGRPAHLHPRFRIPLVRHAAAEAALSSSRFAESERSRARRKCLRNSQRGHASVGRSGVKFSPMTSSTTPVSAAAEQKHQNNDNEDQFHRKSPLKVVTSMRERPAVD